MKNLFIKMTAFFFIASLTLCAQQPQAQQINDGTNETKAREFLDQVAKKYQKDLSGNKGLELSYEYSIFQNRQSGGTNKGSIKIKNNKFYINTPGMCVWYDGKTFVQSAMNNNSRQVQIQENPKKSEMDIKNPYSFLTLYKKGYLLSLDENVVYQGMPCKEVFLRSKQSKSDIQEMYIAFDQNLNPVSIRLRQGKYTWIRIRISNFKAGVVIPDNTFVYDRVEGEKRGDKIFIYN